MGLTERHWFENEEPELTDRQLEDVVREQKDVYKRGYQKGYLDRDKEIVRCKECRWRGTNACFCKAKVEDDWYCSEGERRSE